MMTALNGKELLIDVLILAAVLFVSILWAVIAVMRKSRKEKGGAESKEIFDYSGDDL